MDQDVKLSGRRIMGAAAAIVDEIERFVDAHTDPLEAMRKLKDARMDLIYDAAWSLLNPSAPGAQKTIGFMIVTVGMDADPQEWMADWDGEIYGTSDEVRAEVVKARHAGADARIARLIAGQGFPLTDSSGAGRDQ